MPRAFYRMIALGWSGCWIVVSQAQQATPSPAQPPAAATATAPGKRAEPPKKKLPAARIPKFERHLAANAALSTRVQALLPKGTTLEDATNGFKSETDFIATLHASHDLDIPFVQLKPEVTSSERNSLAQAIRKFHPELDMKAIDNSAKRAEQEAKSDVKETREHQLLNRDW